jgi:hypothetical protein
LHIFEIPALLHQLISIADCTFLVQTSADDVLEIIGHLILGENIRKDDKSNQQPAVQEIPPRLERGYLAFGAINGRKRP